MRILNTSSVSNDTHLKHDGKTAETDNRLSRITSFASPGSTHYCNNTRAEKITLLITKIVTEDMLEICYLDPGLWLGVYNSILVKDRETLFFHCSFLSNVS